MKHIVPLETVKNDLRQSAPLETVSNVPTTTRSGRTVKVPSKLFL